MKEILNLDNKSTPIRLAIISFMIGSLLFFIFMVFPSYSLIVIGAIYVLGAVIINIFSILYLVYQLIFTAKPKKETGIEILIVVGNIPIVAVYLFMLTYRV
jgi:hypothetical protein